MILNFLYMLGFTTFAIIVTMTLTSQAHRRWGWVIGQLIMPLLMIWALFFSLFATFAYSPWEDVFNEPIVIEKVYRDKNSGLTLPADVLH